LDEYDPCCRFRHIGSGRDGNAYLRLAERGCVIGTIAAHPNRMPAFLEGLDEVILAFWKNASEYCEILKLDILGELSGRANRPG
jgi:hypothetical protein